MGTAAQAATVTVDWAGVITNDGGYSGVSINDTISGTFSYDSTSSASANDATFAAYATGHTSTFTLGARSGSFANSEIQVY